MAVLLLSGIGEDREKGHRCWHMLDGAAQRLAFSRAAVLEFGRLEAQNYIVKCVRSWGRSAASAGTPGWAASRWHSARRT